MALPDLSVQAATIPYNYSVLWTNKSTVETITVELKNRNGVTLNLTAADYVVLNAKEYPKDSSLAFSKIGVIDSDGNVGFSFLSTDIPFPGVWYGEFAISTVASKTNVTQRIKCFINTEVAVSVVNQTYDPVVISEVRTSMLDRGEEDNLLLDAEEWSDGQIAIAIIKAVDVWNESLPSSSYTYTQITFPFKQNWLEGIAGELLYSSALNLARNRMPSQSGGIAIDDKSRADVYLALSREYRERYKVWCMSTKAAMNLENCYGSTFNPYYQ
jgi:hypothetical protein